MQLTTETFGRVTVIHTPDELTSETAADFLLAIDDLMTQGHIDLVLEMDRSEVYDSEGLTALLDLQDHLHERGGDVKISGLADPGRKIFELTRLNQRFDIFESVIDAVASFR